MSKALVTFAVGRHTELLEISRPGFAEYARRHGYDYHEGAQPESRPPSWWKVPLLYDALWSYDEVLWLDCDVVIVDPSADIAAEVPRSYWQAMVKHHTSDGEVPNCGVWLVRRPMARYLADIWGMEGYRDHVWWEQAAMLDFLGYEHEPRPVRLHAPTPLYDRTHFLPLEWNSHEQNDRHPSPRFAHVTPNGVDWRLPRMKAYAERALVTA